MKIEGVKLDCHDCCNSFYLNKETIGFVMLCPYCYSPDVVAYNYVSIYIKKPIEDDDNE